MSPAPDIMRTIPPGWASPSPEGGSLCPRRGAGSPSPTCPPMMPAVSKGPPVSAPGPGVAASPPAGQQGSARDRLGASPRDERSVRDRSALLLRTALPEAAGKNSEEARHPAQRSGTRPAWSLCMPLQTADPPSRGCSCRSAALAAVPG